MAASRLLCGSIVFSQPVDNLLVDIAQGTRMTFGTSTSCTVIIPWDHISERHFEIRASKNISDNHDIPVIIKVLSTNPDAVRLNGKVVLPTKPQTLRKGDVVSLGPGTAPSGVFRFLSFDSRSIYARYDFGKILGKGAFGTVQMVQERRNARTLAVKCLAYGQKEGPSNTLKDITNEIAIMQALTHDHLVSAIDIFREPGFVFVVMNVAMFGALDTFMGANILKERDVANCAYQVLSGIAYLHRQFIVHRDIKPKNILVFQQRPILVKVSDFGLAARYTSAFPIITGEVGTSVFMAPEMREATYYTNSVDIYAFGITLWLMLSPTAGPWSHNPVWLPVGNGDWMKKAIEWHLLPAAVNDNARTLLKLLLDTPKNRPSAADALCSPFILAYR